MKTKLKFLMILPFIISIGKSFSQTKLVPGDIAILWMQTDQPDNFAFITFVDLAAGTVIYFSDCGADANGFDTICDEGAKKYTVPAGGISAGSIKKYDATNTDFSSYTDSRIKRSFSLSADGDQIVVFQDANFPEGSNNAAENPKFISAINSASKLFTGDKTNPNETGMPTGLSDTTNPRTAIGLGNGTGSQDEVDNVIYNGTYDYNVGGITAGKIAITNPTNYTSSETIEDTTYAGLVNLIPTTLNLPTLALDQFDSNEEFLIYPNPTKSIVTIKSSNNPIASLHLLDLNGRIINTYNLDGIKKEQNINLNIESGIYFLKINTSKGSFLNKKLIVLNN